MSASPVTPVAALVPLEAVMLVSPVRPEPPSMSTTDALAHSLPPLWSPLASVLHATKVVSAALTLEPPSALLASPTLHFNLTASVYATLDSSWTPLELAWPVT